MANDRRRIKIKTGMGQLINDINPKREDSDVFVNQDIDVTELMEYLDKRKEEGRPITFFHAVVAAVAKTFYNRPKLNYFIANRHLYEHTQIVISFVAKVDFNDASEEIMILIPVNPEDNVDSISKKVKDKVDSIRNHKAKKEGANSAIDILGKMPNVLRVPLVGLFKWMDQRGALPASLCEDNLYYSSIILTNLGALHFGAIYHHLSNFGTCSSLAAIGEVKEKEIINENGKKEKRKLCEFGINFDERVADGFYFIKSLKLIEKILNDPELLEGRADEKIEIANMR